MKFRTSHVHVVAAAALMLVGACSATNTPSQPIVSGAANNPGSPGGAGTSGPAGSVGGAGQAGDGGGAGTSATGQAGNGGAGTTTAQAGTSGGGAGTGAPVGGAGTGAPAAGATGSDAGTGDTDPPALRAINVMPGGKCDGCVGGLSLDRTKTIQGKLVLVLGGICGGPGGGGIEGYAQGQGFHIWKPSTQTCVNSAPQKYKDIIAKTPLDPEANRQVGDARMELWDGVDRVDWVTVGKGQSIVEETQAALKAGADRDPASDWGFFLNGDGTVRWTDVYVVGYSWGSQTLAMISSYVRFGRVFTTSGPQAEGFPNAAWITHPSATPNDRKFMSVGFMQPYPSTGGNDSEVMGMITTVMKAGWIGPATNVMLTSPGPYAEPQHIFAMVGGNGGISPGGHTVFCTDDANNQWRPLCHYAFGVK